VQSAQYVGGRRGRRGRIEGVPAPTHTLIQITDLHIGDDRFPTDPVVAHALRTVEDSGVRPDAVVLTGDLADHGRPEEYERVRGLVAPVAGRLGAAAVYVAGNHDDRAVLRSHLLGSEPSDAPLDHVVRLGDLRIVVLDSTVPGRAYGELRRGQLEWLRAELAEPAPAGTVLALHHPPLPSPSALVAAMELQDRCALAAALEGTDVRIVLAGHTHVVSAGAIAGVPVWTGGAVPYLFDALPPGGGVVRALRLPTISRIDMFADGVIATAAPLDAELLGTIPATEVAAQVARREAERSGRS
jgi:3',5'-cyclic-AMP phosphodiesterase